MQVICSYIASYVYPKGSTVDANCMLTHYFCIAQIKANPSGSLVSGPLPASNSHRYQISPLFMICMHNNITKLNIAVFTTFINIKVRL